MLCIQARKSILPVIRNSSTQKTFCVKNCRLNWLVCWTVIEVWFKMDSFCVFCSGGMQWKIAVSWCSYVKPWFVVIYGKLGLGSRCLKLVPSCPNMLTIYCRFPPGYRFCACIFTIFQFSWKLIKIWVKFLLSGVSKKHQFFWAAS